MASKTGMCKAKQRRSSSKVRQARYLHYRDHRWGVNKVRRLIRHLVLRQGRDEGALARYKEHKEADKKAAWRTFSILDRNNFEWA